MIHYFIKKELQDSIQKITAPEDGCWIHIDEASRSDIEELSKIVDIDISELNDALDRYELPRIEKLDHNIIILFVRHTSDVISGLYTSTMAMLITPNYFITISLEKCSLIQEMIHVNPRITTKNKTTFLIHLLIRLTHDYTLEIKKLRAKVLRQEKAMNFVQSEDITALTMYEEKLNQYFSVLNPLKRVFELISHKQFQLHFGEHEEDLLEDLLHAVNQSEDLCSIILSSIRSLRNAFQIIFTNQLNKTIKLLTALTIILSIPTMVSSLYGMNVALPLEHHPSAFGILITLISAISFGAFYIFHRKKWL
jgi:magnesium transporter